MILQKVDFETAVLLKEKGFDWKTLSRYQDNEDKTVGNDLYNHNCLEEQKLWSTGLYSAPETDLVIKWLREVYSIVICINTELNFNKFNNTNVYYSFSISNENNAYNGYSDLINIWLGLGCEESKFKNICDTFEQAQKQAIIESLKLI